LQEKVAAPVEKEAEDTPVGIRHDDNVALYPQKLALTSPSSGRSIGIVRSRTQAMEFSFSFILRNCQ
jgi:hypothetical protein